MRQSHHVERPKDLFNFYLERLLLPMVQSPGEEELVILVTRRFSTGSIT